MTTKNTNPDAAREAGQRWNKTPGNDGCTNIQVLDEDEYNNGKEDCDAEFGTLFLESGESTDEDTGETRIWYRGRDSYDSTTTEWFAEESGPRELITARKNEIEC